MKKKIWFWLVTVTSVIYILWRLFFTLPTEMGLISLIAGISLFAAELISMLEAVIHCICMSRDKNPEFPVIAKTDYPSVDVLIATHSEETDLLFKTVNGCLHMDYPDKSKVHIFLCDDGNRLEVAKLAHNMGVGYFGFADNKQAKAGNLNHAISKTESPLIVTLDADMIPRSSFLMETIPYFSLPEMILDNGIWRKRKQEEINPDYKIGFVQTPQSFYNPDLFQFNFFAENNIPNEQDYFFREVNVGRNSSNSVIYAGSNTVISRQALDEIGGIATKTITEDFTTGIEIQAKGYTCFAIEKVLASGLAPDGFPELLKQRQRWGRGCVQTICSFKFLFNRLPSYLIYNHSLRLLSSKTRDQKWSNIVDTILCPYMIIPILAETLGLRMKKFSVTSKEKNKSRSAKIIYAIPHIILLVTNIMGICFSIRHMLLYQNILGIIVLFWLCMNAYFLTMAVFFLLGRINYRSSERFLVEIPIRFYTGTRKASGMTCDISEFGLSFKTNFPEFINGVTSFELQDERWSAQVKGEVVHVTQIGNQWKYSVKLKPLSLEEKQAYSQIVFDRFPTLATEIKSSALKDLSVFFKRKTTQSISSKRTLPRMLLNCNLETGNRDKVRILDYNYHYMSVTGNIPSPKFYVKLGKATLHLRKSQSAADGKDNLFEIENWEEISSSDAVYKALQKLLIGRQLNESELQKV